MLEINTADAGFDDIRTSADQDLHLRRRRRPANRELESKGNNAVFGKKPLCSGENGLVPAERQGQALSEEHSERREFVSTLAE
jgi:hypothetical protein